jgi:hypothetical protein
MKQRVHFVCSSYIGILRCTVEKTLKCTLVLYIYLLTAIGLSPGGSTHLHTNNTQNNTDNNRITQIITSKQHKYKLMW